MKKTIAAGGASLLGISAVGLAAAPAAQAAPPDDPCVSIADHVVGAGGANWYMDCIPQYGHGRVNFQITSEVDFPAGFQPLDGAGVTSVSSNTGPEAATYLGVVPEAAGFSFLELVGSDTTHQQYAGDMMFRIASVQAITEEQLEEVCFEGTYSDAYIVNYAPTTVSFTQTVDGEEWRYDVVAAPGPLYLGLSILDTNVFDPTGSMCSYSSSSGLMNHALDANNPVWQEVADQATSVDGTTLYPYFGSGKSFPDTARYVPPAPVPEEPLLPASGSDVSGPLGIAALFLALGVAGGYLRRRRADA